jgi:hypothetical protein
VQYELRLAQRSFEPAQMDEIIPGKPIEKYVLVADDSHDEQKEKQDKIDSVK